MESKQMKWGVVLSYLLIVCNTLFSLLITPYMIGCLGEVEYGVYKTVSSITASMAVLDLGIGSTVMRYVAKYRASHKEHEIPNFMAMSLIQACIVCVVLAIVSIPVANTMNTVYALTFTYAQQQTARILLWLLIGNMMIHVVENVLNGMISGSNRFFVSNGVKLMRLIVRSALLVCLLNWFPDSKVIAVIDIAVTICMLAIEIWYVWVKLRIRPKLTHWDNAVFLDSGKYTLLMFLQNVTMQFNGNVDTILIGAMIDPASVTIYSMALVTYGLYGNLSTAVSIVMLPKVTHMVEENRSPGELQAWVEKTGRLQFIVLGALMSGIIVLGKDFYQLWLGPIYADCYALTLILIIPSTFNLVQNVSLSVLRAQNKMGYYTLTLVGACMANVIISIFGIHQWGYWGAALGTAASSLITLVLMNAYYNYYLKFKITKMFARIFSRTIVCVAAASIVTWVVHRYINATWYGLLLNMSVYVLTYGALMLLWGLNTEEKSMLPILGKRYNV